MEIDLNAERTADPFPTVTRSLEPRSGAALDPLVEEISFVALRVVGATPSAITTRGDIVGVAASFSRILEQAWLPGRSVAIIDLGSTADEDRTELLVHLLVGVAGPRGTTAVDAIAFGSGARRTLRRWPSPYLVEFVDPAPIFDVGDVSVTLIGQRTASVDSDALEASAISRWDRDAASWLEVCDALLENPGTHLRTTLLATELGIDDVSWLRYQLANAGRIAREALETDPDLHHRATRVQSTLLDMLESFRTPVFCGEVAVYAQRQPAELLLRELGGHISCEFDVMRRGETTTVAARTRWVGGHVLEGAPEGQLEALRTGLPLRGGLRWRRLVDLMSLTEAACAFQWPIPAGAVIPTISSKASTLLPAPAGLARTGARVGSDSTGRPILLDRDDRRAHIHIIGATGAGKTTVVDHLLADDVRKELGFLLVDPHGSQAERTVRRLRQAGRAFALFDPADPCTERISLFPLPTADASSREAIDRAVSRLIDAVTSYLPADYAGPRFRELARMALTIVAYACADLTDLSEVLYSHDAALRLVRRAAELGHPAPQAFVSQLSAFHDGTNNDRASVAQWVMSKFDELAMSATLPKALAPAGQGVDIAELISAQIPIVVNLGRTESIETRIMGHLILGGFIDAAMARPPEERTEAPIFIDEPQNFHVANMERAFNEGRKYKLSLAVAHQNLSQLPEQARHAVLGSCSLRIVFRVDEEDATRLGTAMGVRPRDLMGQPNLQAVVHRSDLGSERPAYSCIVDPYADLDDV